MYTPSLNFSMFQCSQWMTYIDLQSFIQRCLSCQFCVKESRDSVRTYYTELLQSAPFGVTRRFPNVLYVCVSNPEISALLIKLLASLSIVDKYALAGDSTAALATSELLRSKVQFFDTVSVLQRLFDPCCMDVSPAALGLFNRNSFEECALTTWVK